MKSDYYKLYNKNKNDLESIQSLYDKETDHHINKEKQLEWNTKIAMELEESEAYSETHLSIKVN